MYYFLFNLFSIYMLYVAAGLLTHIAVLAFRNSNRNPVFCLKWSWAEQVAFYQSLAYILFYIFHVAVWSFPL